ncbi:MAG: DUF3782 domain-containing protein [Euryarchaeota archaeon]|nr:DUF3782 domain-containing protein [Euryarchaeota archaeon]
MEQEETKLSSREVWALFRETDRMFKETREQIAQVNKETDERIAQVNRETSEQIAQVNRETSEQIAQVNRQVGDLTGKWGRFVEGLIAPGAVSMFNKRAIRIDRIYQRIKARKNGDSMEIDILGVNSEYVVLIEAKSTLGVDDIREHIERMDAFKRFFPEYSDRKIVGAVAGIVINENVDKFADRQGLFVIGQSGDTVAILNDESFKPKAW